jgi:hypothetical protein
VLATIAIAPGIARLRLRTDGHALVPERAPAVRLDREVRSGFGIRDPILVLIRSRDPSGIFNPRTLHLTADLTAALARIPGLDSTNVRSLATEVGDRFRPGTLTHRPLLEPVPETHDEIERFRGDLAAVGLLTGTFVSFDGAATAIHIGTPPGADRTALLSSIHDVVARADTAGHEVNVIGAPVAEALLGSHILDDLGIGRGSASNRLEPPADLRSAHLDGFARLRIAIARHIGLLPLSIVLMTLVFLLCFRSLVATALPLVEAGACLVVVFGLMGWMGVPVYLTMAVLPVILVSMGLADEIHVFTCYSNARLARPDAPIAGVVEEAMDEMCLPVVATAMTTAIGFLSFAISPLPPVRAFGLFTAIGILFCMVWTLTVIPAMLVLFAPRAFRSPSRSGRGAQSAGFGWWSGLAAQVGRRPALTLGIALLGLALCPFGIRRLAVQDSWISGFAPESAFYRATQYFNRSFFGTHRLLLALDTGRVDLRGPLAAADMDLHEARLPGDLVRDPRVLTGCSFVVKRPVPAATSASNMNRNERPAFWESTVDSVARRDGRIVITTPITHGSALFLLEPAPGETLRYELRSRRLALPEVLGHIDELERFVRAESSYTVGGVLGPPDQIETAEFLTSDRASGSRVITSDPDRVRWLWSAIALVQGADRVRETVDPEFRRGLVTVFMKNANYIDTARLMDSIRAFEREHLAPERIRLEFAGDVAVSQALIEAIVRSQVGSLLASLLGIFAVTALLFRSLRWGALCMVPAGFAVAFTFAVMGVAGMPLGVATSMFASMSLGIGVDFAIHLIERYRLAVRRGAARDAAILDSLAVTGPPIVVNALAVAFGFGILVLSRVPANARLGSITVVSLLTCLAATLLVMPALLRVAGRGAESESRRE